MAITDPNLPPLPEPPAATTVAQLAGQARTLIAVLGGKVVQLHRDRIGGLDLPSDLQPGAMRVLSDAERECMGVTHYWR